MFKLKKVDFFCINRDQKSFEWFVNLLSQLEAEQQEHGGQELGRFLEMHMFFILFLPIFLHGRFLEMHMCFLPFLPIFSCPSSSIPTLVIHSLIYGLEFSFRILTKPYLTIPTTYPAYFPDPPELPSHLTNPPT